jgi:type IV secretory pathway TrbD component
LHARLQDRVSIRDDEKELYAKIRAGLLERTAAEYAIPIAESEAEIAHYESLLGKRGLLRLLAEPPVILGAAQECVIINGMAAFLVLSVSQNLFGASAAFLLLHFVAIIWYAKQRPRYVAEHLRNIMEKGSEV